MRETAEILQNVYFASSIGSPGADSVQCVRYMLMPTHSSVPSRLPTFSNPSTQTPTGALFDEIDLRLDNSITIDIRYCATTNTLNQHATPIACHTDLAAFSLPLSLYLRPTSTPKVICSQTCSQICCHSEISCTKYFVALEHLAPSYRRLFAIWKR